MRRIAVFSLLLLATVSSGAVRAAETVYIAHCLQGCPAGAAASNEVVVRHLFAASISTQTRLADWVAYRVLPETIGVASLLPRQWRDDPLATSSVRTRELDDSGAGLVQPVLGDQPDSVYRITEFSMAAGDRGRLVPMTSFAGTSYWDDLNRLSVMALISSDLRLEAWSRLDQAINRLVQREGELYVVAGPIYGLPSADPADVDNSRVPQGFFKVIARADGAISVFVFDQQLPVHADFCAQRRDLETVARETGLSLFPDAERWPRTTLDSDLGC